MDIDRLVHEPARFNIMSNLYVVHSADCLFLQKQTGLTWGNLASHLARLEAAGYIQVEKEFVGRKPHTMLHLTDAGRTAFDSYRQDMQHRLGNLPEAT